MRLHKNILRSLIGSMVFMLCAGAFAASPDEFSEMSAGGLLSEATKALSSENYGAAIPYLTEYLERMKVVEDDRVLALMQEVRLKLGKISAWLDDPFGASDWFRQYTETLPLYKPREAFKLLAVYLYEAGLYEECISAATHALTQPLPKGRSKKETKVNYKELSRDELGGLTARKLQRYEKEAEEAGADLTEGFSDDVPDPEPDYTVGELVQLNMTLAEASAALEEWEASLAPYQFVIENATDDRSKGYAILQMVNALIGLERHKEAGAFAVKLYHTNARYDIRVNMALITAAAALSDAGELDSALMLYRMVLPREELVAYQEIKMNELRRDTGLPDVELKIVTNALGRVETLFGNKNSDLSLQGNSSQFSGAVLPAKPVALTRLEELVVTLISLPPYEIEVLYRTGALYAEVGRPWEALAALDIVAGSDPESGLGRRAFAESLLVLVDPLEEYERVETLAKQFLEAHIEGLVPRMVAYALTGCYQKQEQWKEIKELLPVIEQFVPSEDAVIRRYECELCYMQAIADLILFNYKQALAGFTRVLTDFPASHQQENATHWHAMSQQFLKNYEAALAEFETYRAVYPAGAWLPEAVFHGGICLFGMEKTDEAQQRFTEVIKKYPDSQVYPDACSLRGDILASKGMLNEAQHDYEEAIATARNTKQGTYAVFQLASMFEMEDRYDEILDIVDAYLARYDKEADVAKAAYWIGKTKLAQGLVDEAVAAYREVIIKYGGNILQDGVDLIIVELAKVAKRLEIGGRQQLEERLRADADAADNATLKLRLRVLLAKMDGSELELGKELINELSDLTQAPPPVLAVLCDSSFETKDYSRAAEILDLFQTRYEESELMKAALKLRGYEMFEAQQYNEALKIAEEAQALYGTDIDVVWAQILKGRIFLHQGEFNRARELFSTTLAVSQWRGDAYAEATYYLGEVEEAAGSLRDAFAWYQRAYFQYKGLAGGYWAAEGYLASARCLKSLGMETDMLNTYRAMLFDKYINTLPQADVAREALGAQVVQEINTLITQGVHTNLTIKLSAEATQ